MSDEVQVVYTDADNAVEVIVMPEMGPQGIPGTDAASAIPGNITGDFLRWNEAENAWEVKSEPIEFGQIILTPAAAAILDQEGSLWYDSVGKSVMVCTDI